LCLLALAAALCPLGAAAQPLEAPPAGPRQRTALPLAQPGVPAVPGVTPPAAPVPLPAPPWAQFQNDEPIFRRFTTPPTRSERRLRIFEVPVALRPQTDPRAEVQEDLGIGYTMATQPFNRLFVSAGFDFARLTWQPSDPAILRAQVRQLDVHQNLNAWLWRRLIVGVGFGLGVLDGLVLNADGTFEHNLVPYVPVRVGVGILLGDKVYVGLRAVATPFFGEGHEIGHSRLLLGLGWVY
jgi:hypothetical protein